MTSIATQLIHYIKRTPEILGNRDRFKSLLNDLFPNRRDFINILTILYFDIQIAEEFRRINKTDIYFISRISKKIVNEFHIDKLYAEEAVRVWIDCLTNINIEIPIQKPSEKTIIENQRKFEPENETIYIPCGVGYQDNGFKIKGIKTSDAPCEHYLANIYSIILGYHLRTLNARESRGFKYLQKKLGLITSYRRVYRLIILFLILIKNNYFVKNQLEISLKGFALKDANLAIETINFYSKLFCKLSKISHESLVINFKNDSKLLISNNLQSQGISIVDSNSRVSNHRIIWFESSIKYQIDSGDIPALKFLLNEVFGLGDFLPGQITAIMQILNSDTQKLCIMPTGSGKSLIFYFITILQPSPTMILMPSKILIEDQCDILINKHEVDDFVVLGDHDNISDFIPTNKFIFLTPLSFISSMLIKNLICLNLNNQLSNFILDEVHCISNWSHDFRPEYLMLSFNLKYYVDKTRPICFTATANYTVVRDILTQLNFDLSANDIISPIELKNDNQQLVFRKLESEKECISELAGEIDEFLEDSVNNRQLLIFTKNEPTSSNIKSSLRSELQVEVEVFSKKKRESYREFASNRYKVLIADSELGIGINLPGVTNTVHFGVPLSKSQFVQEIGRAGRDNKNSISKVIYRRRDNLTENDRLLLHRNTSIPLIIDQIKKKEFFSDLDNAFIRIFGGIESQAEYFQGVISLFENIRSIKNSGEIRIIFKIGEEYENCLFSYMRYLYVLYRIGYLFNWYILSHDLEEHSVTFLVEVADRNDLDSIISTTNRYLLNMGDYKENVNKIRNSKSMNDVIENYVLWYYNQFLYHHREQFLNMYEFLELNETSGNFDIINSLRDYFSLSLFDNFEDIEKYNKFTIRDINILINQGISSKLINDIQRGMENEYSVKQDLTLFLYNFKSNNNLDISRFDRIISNLSKSDLYELLEIIVQIYEGCDIENKLSILDTLCTKLPIFDLLNIIYSKLSNDIVFFSIFSKCANTLYSGVS